jgi:hypothetical protein
MQRKPLTPLPTSFNLAPLLCNKLQALACIVDLLNFWRNFLNFFSPKFLDLKKRTIGFGTTYFKNPQKNM